MAVAVLFTASCAKEDISSSIVGGGEVEMTFTVDLPELGTRANTYGNGANATLLRYYVFDAANGAELEALRGTATRTSGNFTFTLPLLKGMKYNIALWADKNMGTKEAPKGYYKFDGKVVTVSYFNANDNDRDAFYHYEPNFDPTDPRTTSFQLYRPFAQLNAAVVDSDIEAVAKNGVALETSTVKVTTYTQFNLATGDVVETSETEVNFTATDMPYEAGETLKDGYKYLSMNYLLVPKAGMVSNVTFTFNNDKNIDFDASYDNVPLKQNYRTNILGKLLTASTEFTVTIEADFGTPAEVVWDGQSITEPTKNSNGAYVITSPAELAWLAASVNGTVSRAGEPKTFLGETFVLDSDINLGGQLWTPIGQSSKISVFRGTFDGQGHTISGLKVQNEDGAGLFGYVSGNIKNLTIDGAEITSHHYAGALVGWLQSVDSQAHNRCNVINCHAKNVKVALTPDANHDNGDKAGALIGYSVRLTIENCTVENAEVTAYRDVAGLVGCLNSGSTLSNCSVANTEVVADQRPEYIEVKAPNAGKVAGSVSSAATIDNCTADNVNVTLYISGSKNKTIEISEPYNYVFENLTVKTTSGPAVQIAEDVEATISLVGDVVLEAEAGSGIDATNATLTLVGGNNNKLTAKGNGDRAFGIGGSGATVTLNGVNVDYVCGGHIQPLFINDSKFGKSEPEGGAAIGGAVVNILNSTITKADGGSKAAAIGAKFWESAVINIENSTILEANGGNASAGIGGSRYANDNKYNLEINIKNSNVTATGGQYGAGIGSGYDTHCNQEDYTAKNEINIDAASTVNATGGKYAAGIGTGHHSAYLTGSIAAGANVTAVSGEKFYKDSYTTAQNIGYGVMDPAREFSGANTTVTFTVAGEVIAAPKASITVNSADDFANVEAGDRVVLAEDITLTEALTLPAGITLNGNGKQIDGTIYAGGDLTFEGHTKVTAFNASYYNRTITIGEGACLEVTGTGRVSLAYGNTFNITGNVDDAKTADKATIQPSLIIPAGISITGGNDATMNITNAYVKIGSTSSKNSAANGTFTINIENSIAEFTDQLTFAEPTNGNNPTFNLNVEDSVLITGTKLCIAAPNSNMVVDNSIVTLGTYLRNSGTISLINGSVLTGATIQFGENGGNNGTINVDASSMTIIAGSTGNAFDGKSTGKINATNGATINVDYYKAMTINVDASTFTGTEVQ